MTLPFNFAVLPLEPTRFHLIMEDIPHHVFEALCDRLEESPATVSQLVDTAKAAGSTAITSRLVEQWLEKQRRTRFIECVDGKWQVRNADTSV
jgi:hypothetical protein